MKKWYMWLVLSGIWVLITVLNIFSERSGVVIGYNIFVAAIFAILGIAQYFCDKKGEAGKKQLRAFYIGAVILAVAAFALILLM